MISLQFLRNHWRELAFGFLMCFLSGFGQTYFVSLFGGEIREEFAISDGQWGTIYSAGTIMSAFVLMWSRQLVDRLRLATMAAISLGGAAIMCVGGGIGVEPCSAGGGDLRPAPVRPGAVLAYRDYRPARAGRVDCLHGPHRRRSGCCR